ncbi:hypothetical protein [Flavicella marina]|uniref:hypothetical protein n=1 Tax=Flavicella marina TaxID=1475951 RepID=UPI0012653937|nr:hypothetical protein [Flavicella marina]
MDKLKTLQNNTFVIYLVKTSILSAAFHLIYSKITHFHFSAPSFQINELVLLIGLTLGNWSLEIVKWRTLVSSINPISFHTAAIQSLAAHTVSVITPNKMGEYGAKLFFFKPVLHKKIISLTLLSNGYQLLVTVLFGCFGFYYYRPTKIIDSQFLLIAILAIGLITVSIYFSKKIKKLFEYFTTIHRITQLKLFVLSSLRYLLFSFQYVYLLKLLGTPNTFTTLFPLVCVMYFTASFIPSFAITDFAIKGSVALLIFSEIHIPNNIILTTAFAMWLLNFAFPALIGSFFVAKYKPQNNLQDAGNS